MSETASPRYEFRLFAQSFSEAEARLRMTGTAQDTVETHELYLLLPHQRILNVKIRNGQFDIKRLVAVYDELEQWKPILKCPVPPVSTSDIDSLTECLGTKLPDCSRHDGQSFIRELLATSPGMLAMQVLKRRSVFALAESLGEVAEVSVNGAWTFTLCIESTDPQAVLKQRHHLGLENTHNENYVRALQRIAGLCHESPWPEAIFSPSGK